MPLPFSAGDHVVTPDGRVVRVQYLTTYVRNPETGESEPTEAIVLVPKQVRQFNDPSQNRKNPQKRGGPNRRHRTTTHFDSVRYKIGELAKATIAERERTHADA